MNFLPRFHRYLSSFSDTRTPLCCYFQWAPEQTSAKRIWPIFAVHRIDHAIHRQQVFHFFHLFNIWLGKLLLYMLYVFRRGSSSRIIGDDGRRVNMAIQKQENRFYCNFYFHRHTHHYYFFYNSRLPKAIFGQSFPFQRDIFNHNSGSMGTALNTVSLCNRTDLTGLTSFTACLHTHTHSLSHTHIPTLTRRHAYARERKLSWVER